MESPPRASPVTPGWQCDEEVHIAVGTRTGRPTPPPHPALHLPCRSSPRRQAGNSPTGTGRRQIPPNQCPRTPQPLGPHAQPAGTVARPPGAPYRPPAARRPRGLGDLGRHEDPDVPGDSAAGIDSACYGHRPGSGTQPNIRCFITARVFCGGICAKGVVHGAMPAAESSGAGLRI
jgi:hypothetical protein